MNKGVIISGIGHVGLILWAMLGGWLFAAQEIPEIKVVDVAMISTAEFDAMTSAAPAVPDVAPAPVEPPAATPDAAVEVPAEPDTTPAAEAPTAEPAPAVEPAPTTDAAPEAPMPPDPVPVEAQPQPDPVPPDPVAPPADLPQPVQAPRTSTRPKARPATKIAEAQPEPVTDTTRTADKPVPEVTETPTPEPPTPEVPEPPAKPEVTTPEVQPETADVATQAPKTSKRPQSRPKAVKPDAAAETSTDDQAARDKAAAEKAAQKAADQAAADKAAAEKAAKKAADQAAADQADAEKAAIAAALAAAAGSGTDTGDSGPKGPPMTNSEIGDLHRAIESKWNIGALSTEASEVVIKVAVVLSRDQKPVSITLLSGEGGSDVAIKRAFDAARSAIYRAASSGFNLPPEKFDDWKDLEMTFDPSSGALR